MSASERLSWFFNHTPATKIASATVCETSVAHVRRWCRSEWENGQSQPRVWQFSQLCNYLQVSPTWLLNGKGPQTLGELMSIYDPNDPMTNSYRLSRRLQRLPHGLHIYLGIFTVLLARAAATGYATETLKSDLKQHAARFQEFAAMPGGPTLSKSSDEFDSESLSAKQLLNTPAGRMKWLRKERSLTHANIAQAIVGVTTRAYTYWENSDWTIHSTRQPYAHTLHRICQHTGIAESWVMWGKGPASLAYIYPAEDAYLPESVGGPNPMLKECLNTYYHLAQHHPRLREFIHNLIEYTYSLWVARTTTIDRLLQLIDQFCATYQLPSPTPSAKSTLSYCA